MAAVSYKIFVFDNGKKATESKTTEILFKALELTHDGASNGAVISSIAGGHFAFNSKKLTDVAAGVAGTDAVNKNQLDTKIDNTEKGANNGVATLDAGGKVPYSQLPPGFMTYKGVWNANTNTPALVDGTGTQGDVYKVSVSGSQNLGSGSIDFTAGDWIIYNGSTWEKADNSDAVMSVNGQTGVVTLTTSHIAEGTNLYWTSGRFDTAFATKSTSDLAEGTNLYYTATRFNTAFAAKSTSDLAEGTNKYFTNARAVAALTEEALVNDEGATVTALQIGVRVAGKFQLAIAADAALKEGCSLYVVKDASILDQVSGGFYKHGADIPGFTGLTVDAPVYVSRTTAGGYTQSLTGFVTGEKVVLLGTAKSATELEFKPEYLFEMI